MKRGINLLATLLCGITLPALVHSQELVYENKLEIHETGAMPDEFLVLGGDFRIEEENGNKFLLLPGAPLDSFGLLFGPTEKNNVQASARMFGTARGRRYPAFAVGLSGFGGYRLQVSPAKKAIELFKGDEVRATVPFEWKANEWTHLLLRLRQAKESEWIVEGKAWTAKENEPKDWTISSTETEEPLAGRASIWGSPFSGTPIKFDDLKVVKF